MRPAAFFMFLFLMRTGTLRAPPDSPCTSRLHLHRRCLDLILLAWSNKLGDAAEACGLTQLIRSSCRGQCGTCEQIRDSQLLAIVMAAAVFPTPGTSLRLTLPRVPGADQQQIRMSQAELVGSIIPIPLLQLLPPPFKQESVSKQVYMPQYICPLSLSLVA
jgi:hypothetical protein